MIKIRNLNKNYKGTIAIDNISFTVEEGEVLGFLGPNGAGKSSTMKMLAGFISASSGTISIFSFDICKDALQAKKMIGYLPEGAPSYGEMKVYSYLKFIAEIHGFKDTELVQRVKAVIEQLSLETVQYSIIDTLSKGFKRRVGLAQAIIHNPKILILDEPTDGLDPNQKKQVRQLISRLSKDKIVIISTHILEEVSAICTRAIIIDQGKIMIDGTPKELEKKSEYYGAITIEIEENQDLYDELMLMPNVRLVKKNKSEYIIFPEYNQCIQSDIQQYIKKNNWTLKSFSINRGQLEDVFRDLTTQNKNI